MPEGFSMGKLEGHSRQSDWVLDDANSTEPMNVEERVNDFVATVLPLAEQISGNDVMLTMGGDFDWNNGERVSVSTP